MNSNPRLQEKLTVSGLFASFTTGWINWFSDVKQALNAWNQSIPGMSASLNFPSIAAHTQSILTASVVGARGGDVVLVQPATYHAGILFNGYVTADDTVSIVATNITGAAVDPAADIFSIIVFQKK